MPRVEVDEEEKERFTDKLFADAEGQERTGTHVSDLILCLRQPTLTRKYLPIWSLVTLLRFTMGRALEKSVFKLLLPYSTEELEVKKDGIEGHIDFGSDPLDVECKLTWKHKKSPDDLLDSNFWWFEQAGAYAYMRERTSCRLVVLYLFPIPQLESYRVTWEQEELDDLWEMFLERKKYMENCEEEDDLPMRTPLTWLCKGCPVEKVCYELPD